MAKKEIKTEEWYCDQTGIPFGQAETLVATDGDTVRLLACNEVVVDPEKRKIKCRHPESEEHQCTHNFVLTGDDILELVVPGGPGSENFFKRAKQALIENLG